MQIQTIMTLEKNCRALVNFFLVTHFHHILVLLFADRIPGRIQATQKEALYVGVSVCLRQSVCPYMSLPCLLPSWVGRPLCMVP